MVNRSYGIERTYGFSERPDTIIHAYIGISHLLLLLNGAVPIIKAEIPAPLGCINSLSFTGSRHPIQFNHVLLFNGNDLEIVLDTLGRDRFGKNSNTPVDLIGNADSGGRRLILLGNGVDFGVREERSVWKI